MRSGARFSMALNSRPRTEKLTFVQEHPALSGPILANAEHTSEVQLMPVGEDG
jgi:hypothetical protein